MTWDFNFWQRPKSARHADSVTVASTTDELSEVEKAAKAHIKATTGAEPSFIYTELRPAIQEQDGSTEHNDPIVITDVPENPAREESELVDILRPLSPQMEAGAMATYQAQLQAARAAHSDFDEVVGQARKIPIIAQRMMWKELPNGAEVAYWLGKRLRECDKLCEMQDAGRYKGIQARMTAISADLATNEAAAMDTKPHREFRAIRDRQTRLVPH